MYSKEWLVYIPEFEWNIVFRLSRNVNLILCMRLVMYAPGHLKLLVPVLPANSQTSMDTVALNENKKCRTVIISTSNNIRNSRMQSTCSIVERKTNSIEGISGQVRWKCYLNNCSASASLTVKNPKICFFVFIDSFQFDCCCSMYLLKHIFSNEPPVSDFIQFISNHFVVTIKSP